MSGGKPISTQNANILTPNKVQHGSSAQATGSTTDVGNYGIAPARIEQDLLGLNMQLVNLNQMRLMNLDSDKYHATYDKETHNVSNIKNIENDTTNVHEILNGHIVKGSQFT